MTTVHSEDPILLLLRRWRVLALAAGLGAILGIAFYLFMPKWYEAELTIMPVAPSRGLGAAAGLASGQQILAGFGLGVDLLGGSASERVAAVLQSRSVSDEIIERFHLTDRYEMGYLEKTRKVLWARCTLTVSKKSDLVDLVCEDKDPAFVRDMVKAFGDVANDALRRVSATTAGEERRFLEKQVVQARAAVDDASRALREFQEQHDIIDVEEQAKAVVTALASLEGQHLSKELELAYVASFSASDEARSQQLRRQINIIDDKLVSLTDVARAKQRGNVGARGNRGVFPAAMAVPELRYELERLYREQKIREAVYLLLTQRHEMAKADEVRDSSAFQVLDEPVLPTYRAWPRLRVVPFGFLAGLFLGIGFVLLPGWWRALDLRARFERGAKG
jgi:uncharacterized protein involved in exopolysaccharide biosynthesis